MSHRAQAVALGVAVLLGLVVVVLWTPRHHVAVEKAISLAPPRSKMLRHSVYVPPNSHSVRVVSVGGVGTTFLMRWLKKNAPEVLANDANDKDNQKHSIQYNGEKVLYVVGEPRHSIESHYRNGWAQLQMGKLKTASEEAILGCSSLSQYISLASKRGEDLFGIKKHFEIWSRRSNVLVTSLESIKVDPEPVALFMHVDPASLDSLRAIARRTRAAPEFGPAIDPLYDALWDEEQRWAFGYRPDRCRSQNKRFVYLIRSQQMRSSYEAMKWCANEEASCDVLVLTWGDDTTSHGENHIAAPGIQWAAGRNLLLKTAMERNDYEYYTFVDEEVTLVPIEKCSQSGPGRLEEPFITAYRCSQDFLESRRPVVAYAATTEKDAAITAHLFFDGAFNSYHRSATAFLLPYMENTDAIFCQYVVNLLSGMFVNTGRVSFRGIIALDHTNNLAGGNESRAFNRSSHLKAASFVAGALSPLGKVTLCKSIPNPESRHRTRAPVGLGRSEQLRDIDANPFGSSPPPVLSEAQISRVLNLTHPLAERSIVFRRSLPVACALHASQAEHGRFVSLSIESATFITHQNGCQS